jgi:hypothetical protein
LLGAQEENDCNLLHENPIAEDASEHLWRIHHSAAVATIIAEYFDRSMTIIFD